MKVNRRAAFLMPDSPEYRIDSPFNFVCSMQEGVYYFHIDQLIFMRAVSYQVVCVTIKKDILYEKYE